MLNYSVAELRFISSNKYFITNNIYPKRDKMKHILKPETKESPYYIRKGKVIDK